MYDERWVMELEIPGGEDAPTYNAAGKHMITHLFMTCLWELEGSYWTYRNLPAQQIENHAKAARKVSRSTRLPVAPTPPTSKTQLVTSTQYDSY
ncbi:hypothetical protein RB195_001766 [Necator americanus]|uniref:Uncharacterized protein n=1 Tax=Necator americanus TaxID=51031 RepID=A0ABR1DG73_NECAM